MSTKPFLYSIIFTLIISNTSIAQTNVSDVSLDHITIAVSDLDKATKSYSDLGFTFKDGRLHSNGLLNKHIKFKDGSSVELMTVKGDPGDELAERYRDFLDLKVGGIFIALRAPLNIVQKKADELGLSYNVNSGNPFSYLTFENKGITSFYFINYENSISDPDSITTHSNNVRGIKAVWITASPLFTELLIELGAEFHGIIRTPDEKENAVYRINGYDFIIDDATLSDSQILGIQFDSTDILPPDWLPPSENHGVWVTFR